MVNDEYVSKYNKRLNNFAINFLMKLKNEVLEKQNLINELLINLQDENYENIENDMNYISDFNEVIKQEIAYNKLRKNFKSLLNDNEFDSDDETHLSLSHMPIYSLFIICDKLNASNPNKEKLHPSQLTKMPITKDNLDYYEFSESKKYKNPISANGNTLYNVKLTDIVDEKTLKTLFFKSDLDLYNNLIDNFNAKKDDIME